MLAAFVVMMLMALLVYFVGKQPARYSNRAPITKTTKPDWFACPACDNELFYRYDYASLSVCTKCLIKYHDDSLGPGHKKLQYLNE